MKAKDLAEILLMTPDAEVVHYEYLGGPTILIKIGTVKHESCGEQSESSDGGDFIKNGIVEKDILILCS